MGTLVLAFLVLSGAGTASSAEFAGLDGASPQGGAPPSTHRAAGSAATVGAQVASPWNHVIPAAPVLDPRSPSMVRRLAAAGRAHANLYDYGIPVYAVTDSTPLRHVECTKPWGGCDLERSKVPIPATARPNAGSDGVMVIIHRARGIVYEFWQARKTSTGWKTSWGTVTRLYGDPGIGTTGSGISRLAGIVRTHEMANRNIPHALAFSTDSPCSRPYRYPALKSDGTSGRSDCIPQGARVQLDPKVDLGRIRMSPGERTVAQALQRYGAYVVDAGAARMAFGFEKPTSGADPYPAAGLSWDYFAMERIPWGSLRVLRRWDGR